MTPKLSPSAFNKEAARLDIQKLSDGEILSASVPKQRRILVGQYGRYMDGYRVIAHYYASVKIGV